MAHFTTEPIKVIDDQKKSFTDNREKGTYEELQELVNEFAIRQQQKKKTWKELKELLG